MNIFASIRTEVFGIKTQGEFAALIGVDQSTVHRWERGSKPTIDHVATMIEKAPTKAAKKKILDAVALRAEKAQGAVA